MEDTQHSAGYYQLSITSTSRYIMRSNSERAFIIAKLQDLLSPRYTIGDIPVYKQLASCVDLLAFSIRAEAIELVIFSIDHSIATYFSQTIANQLIAYQHEHTKHTATIPASRCRIQKLRGPHHALARTVAVHHLHEDWEYDRYSSIGFYLHDRRGDWMRTWRLATLYENNELLYRKLFLNHPFKNLEDPSSLTLRLLAS